MKYLYVIPLLLPQIASACIGSGTDNLLNLAGSIFIAAIFISLVINSLMLIGLILLPRNKGLTMSAIFTKAKSRILFVTIAVLLILISIWAVLSFNDIFKGSNDSYTDPNGKVWLKAC